MFAADLQRDTTIERLRSMVSKWMSYGLCVPIQFGTYCDRWFVNGAMSCETPVRIQYIARSTFGATAKKPLTLEVLHRCRKCKSCEKARSRMWAARAAVEFERSARTWFGTLTLGPQEHAVVDQLVSRAGLWPDRSRLSEAQFEKALFRARASIVGEQVSSWLTIVREFAFMRLHKREQVRYLLVAEKHDSNKTAVFMRHRPHFHMILHEMSAGAVFAGSIEDAKCGVDNADLVLRKERGVEGWVPFVFAKDDCFARRAWPLGHTKFKYCDTPRAAHYICNYLYESDMTRMRASVRYGKVSVSDEQETALFLGAVGNNARQSVIAGGSALDKNLAPPRTEGR